MLEHKLSRLLVDQHLSRFGSEAREVTLHAKKPPEEPQ